MILSFEIFVIFIRIRFISNRFLMHLTEKLYQPGQSHQIVVSTVSAVWRSSSKLNLVHLL